MGDTPEKRSLLAAPEMATTVELRPGDGGQTTISYRLRLRDRSRLSLLKLRLARPMIRRTFARNAGILAEVLARDGLSAER